MLFTIPALVLVFTVAALAARQPLAPHTLGLELTAEDSRTLRVNRVDAESVGGGMGLQPGDRIVSVNGSPAASPWAVRNAVLAGTPAVLHLHRGEERFRCDVSFDTSAGLTPTVAAVRLTPLG